MSGSRERPAMPFAYCNDCKTLWLNMAAEAIVHQCGGRVGQMVDGVPTEVTPAPKRIEVQLARKVFEL